MILSLEATLKKKGSSKTHSSSKDNLSVQQGPGCYGSSREAPMIRKKRLPANIQIPSEVMNMFQRSPKITGKEKVFKVKLIAIPKNGFWKSIPLNSISLSHLKIWGTGSRKMLWHPATDKWQNTNKNTNAAVKVRASRMTMNNRSNGLTGILFTPCVLTVT